MKKLMITLTVLGLLAVPLLGPMDATAFTLYYWQVFNGATPTSVAPWLTADFEQDGTDTVDLTLTGHLVDINNVSTGEYFDQIVFNIDPNITPSAVNIAYVSGPVTAAIDNTTQNAQNLNGGGALGFDFDIKFDYPSSASNRFNDSLVAIFTLTAPGLTPGSFDYTNPSGYLSGAHIAGIPPIPPSTQTTSGAVYATETTGSTTVPEPSTMLLVGTGLVGLGLLRNRI